MHPRLGCVTLSLLAFSGEGNLNFPWEKSYWDHTVVKQQLLKKGHAFNEIQNLLITLIL